MKMRELAKFLETVKGKKVYGCLKKPFKAQVDAIVDELEMDSEALPQGVDYGGVLERL